MKQRGGSNIWIVFVTLAIVVGAILLIRPSKSTGVFQDKFNFIPKVGAQLPVFTKLTDSTGKKVVFGDFLKSGRPVMLLPIFYRCNGVCYNEIESLTKTLVKEATVSTKQSSDSVLPGRDFDLVVVSLHPRETTELAASKKAEMLSVFRLGMEKLSPADQDRLDETLSKGLHFTIGDPDEVKKLVESMGFFYTYDAKQNWVYHPGVAGYVSTQGKVVGYNTGANFATKTVRVGVQDAAEFRNEPVGDVALLGCFKMQAASPATKFVITALNWTACLFVLGMAFMIVRWNRQFPDNSLPPGGPNL